MRSIQHFAVAVARFIVVVALVASVTLLGIGGFRLCKPVADVRPETASRIQPGMTEDEASAIVGAPSGWYDGVVMMSSGAPKRKGHVPKWYGRRGVLVYDQQRGDANAEFYPAKSVRWSLPRFILERLTRRSQSHLYISTQERMLAFLILLPPGVICISVWCLKVSGANVVANHGGVGLLVGLLSAAISFWIAQSEWGGIIFILLGSIGGAILGTLVGVARAPKGFNDESGVAEPITGSRPTPTL
jgi:hypothetical protein